MMNSLHRFFWEDSRTRWSGYSVTVIAGVIYASVRTLAFHKPERQVNIELLVFLLISNFAAVLVYWLRSRKIAREAVLSAIERRARFLSREGALGQFPFLQASSAEAVPPKRIPTFIACGGLIACVILLGASRLSVSTVQAAIVNRRLDRAASSIEPDRTANLSPNQLKDRFQNIASIANTYREYKIQASPELVKKVTSNLEGTLKSVNPGEDARKSGVAAFVALVAYARYNNVLIAVNAPTVLLPHGETGNSMISQVPLTNGSIWWQGSAQGNTIFALPTPASEPVFPIVHSNVVFNAVNFNGFGMGRSFVGTDEESQVVVMNATVEGTSQKLDSIVWLNIKFKNSKIIYDGGPLYLREVTFENCQFQIGNDPESQKVLAHIRQSGDEPLTLASGL